MFYSNILCQDTNFAVNPLKAELAVKVLQFSTLWSLNHFFVFLFKQGFRIYFNYFGMVSECGLKTKTRPAFHCPTQHIL